MRHHILMGDVIGSASHDATTLRTGLAKLIADGNDAHRADLLSPMTTTLGDEFQGVCGSCAGLVAIIFALEEALIEAGGWFRLHYVAHLGAIDTPINPDIAYGMMGPGLTRARSLLGRKMRSRPRFTFDYADDGISSVLNSAFRVVDSIASRWQPEDCALIIEMIRSGSDKAVAERLGRDRSLIWKRRRTLRVSDYADVKQAMLAFAGLVDARLLRYAETETETETGAGGGAISRRVPEA